MNLVLLNFVWSGVLNRRKLYPFFSTMLITWILMFAGSFGLEYLTVRWIFKDKSRAVMWAILSGNVLSYCFIVISLLVKYWIK